MSALKNLRYTTHQKIKDFMSEIYCYDHELLLKKQRR